VWRNGDHPDENLAARFRGDSANLTNTTEG
jgi:hypothetical protein